MIEIRALREGDTRGAFRSGDADLDRFFQQFADHVRFSTRPGLESTPGRVLMGFLACTGGMARQCILTQMSDQPQECGPYDDLIVADVRRVRTALFQAAGNDIHEFCRGVREIPRSAV